MDNALEVEPGDEKVIGHCDRCGHETRTFRGFVNDQDGAYAVYLCTYTASHPELGVDMVVSIGGWGAGNDPSLKQCIALEWRQAETGPGCRVIDASDSRWHGIDFLGRMLSREQAMNSAKATEAFAVTDAVWQCDQRLAAALTQAGARHEGLFG